MQRVERFLRRIWVKAGLRRDLDDLTQETLLELLQDLGLEEFERLLNRFEAEPVHLLWADQNSRPILRVIDRVKHRAMREKKMFSLNGLNVYASSSPLSLSEVTDRLTKRELQVFTHLLSNLTTEQIAERDERSLSSIRNLQTRIFKKIKEVA
jgi:DNA-binding CsgD family transcriptional regulator